MFVNVGLVGVSIQSLSEQKKEDLINGLATRVLDLSAEIQNSIYNIMVSEVRMFNIFNLMNWKKEKCHIFNHCNLVE